MENVHSSSSTFDCYAEYLFAIAMDIYLGLSEDCYYMPECLDFM